MKAGVKATSIESVGRKARTADRRSAVFALVRQVAADLVVTSQLRHLTTSLIERLGHLSGARSIRLKEISASMPPRSLQPIRARDYVAYTVPVKEPGRQVMLEAAFDSRSGPDEWTCQLIEVAANLASLLVEVERLANTPPALNSAERDGAAPLIGSSEVMCALRDRVERVASTDFTVLIEGPSDPQQ